MASTSMLSEAAKAPSWTNAKPALSRCTAAFCRHLQGTSVLGLELADATREQLGLGEAAERHRGIDGLGNGDVPVVAAVRELAHGDAAVVERGLVLAGPPRGLGEENLQL